MPRTYDAEFRRRVVELVRAGRPVRVVAAELGLAEATVYRWKAQDLIDRGMRPGTSTSEQGELAAAKRRIQELETELALVKRAAALFEEGVRPKAKYPVIADLAGQGFWVMLTYTVGQGHLWVATGQRRTGLRPRRDRQPQDGAQDHAVARSVWAARIQEAVPQQGEQSNCR